MRILHVSTRLILGGSQENTVLSCEGQARLGHDVHLAFGPIYGPEGSLLDRVKNFRTADGRGITTHTVPDLCREISPLRDVRAYRQLRGLVAGLRPDVVHTHSSKAGIVGRVAAWDEWMHDVTTCPVSAGGPVWTCRVVHTIHGPPFMPVEGGALARAKTRVMNRVYKVAERHAASRCHTIVSVADAMTREFLRRGIGAASQYVTVRSGMETGPYLTAGPGETRAEVRARLGLSPSNVVIGTVARLAQHKGHDDLLAALGAGLLAEPRLKLLWVGDGWWRGRLIAKARAMGLGVAELDGGGGAGGTREGGRPSQILLTGMVVPERIPGLIRSMDVLAHPSYREGLPRTVPQALLCGVCPVAYDVDGTGEVCREMETGRLVPVGDIGRLREAVAWCAEHPAERAELSRRGREECLGWFSADTMVDRLDEVYRRPWPV